VSTYSCITQDEGGHGEVVEGAPEHLPFSGERGVERLEAGRPLDQPLIVDADPPAAGYPAEVCVEDQDGHDPQPEYRGRVAHQTDDAGDMVDPGAPAHGRQHAQRNAQAGADQQRGRGQLDRGREDAGEVVQHRIASDVRLAEVESDDVDEIAAELLPDRPVEPERTDHLLDVRLVHVR